jgi:hypothetical protein
LLAAMIAVCAARSCALLLSVLFQTGPGEAPAI